MDVNSRDVYEQKLFQMFKSCDTRGSGALDVKSLKQLCTLLELNDDGERLITDLAGCTVSGVRFDRFKQALLKFIGSEWEGSTMPNSDAVKERDGGRSNVSIEQSLIITDDDKVYAENSAEFSDREVSPKLVVGKKKYGRRSRPQVQIIHKIHNNNNNNNNSDLTQSEDDESYNSDDIGNEAENGHRSCDFKLNCNSNTRVQRSTSQTDIPDSRRRRPPTAVNGGSKLKRCSSLPAQRNMHSLGKKTTTSTLLPVVKPRFLTTNKSTQASQDNTATQLDSSIESLESPTQLETLPTQSILDIWESANIANGKAILLALGFHENEVNLSQLNKVLEEELRSLDDEQQSTLLRASLALQSAELAAIRLTYRQLHAENAKLRLDNKETNRRIALQAVEIDERHAALEEASKNEIRQLEQKHAVIVRDLTSHMTGDREHWSTLSAKLEARLKSIELDDLKLKTEMELLRTENTDMEKEQRKLQKQIAELLEKNVELSRDIVQLVENSTQSNEHRSDDDDYKTSSSSELLHLSEKVFSLQEENTNLRDKNDELVTEMENLNLELTRTKAKNKKSGIMSSTFISDADEESNEASTNASMSATKRRGDSPSKTHSIEEESPRLGKLRKCASNGDMAAGENSDTSGEWIPLNSELQHSEKLATSSSLLSPNDETTIALLKKQITELQDKLQQSSSRSKKNDAEERCKELEGSLEQMQRAYEDCEDYWQSKLSEERQLAEKERQIYEEEQQENDKKFTELMEKIREYEEQFSKDGRLSPIVARDDLEEQYADLEAELETSLCDAAEKSKTIVALKSEINELREILTGASDLNDEAAVAAVDAKRMSNAFSDAQSNASSPISYLWHQSTIQEPAKNYTKLEELSMQLATKAPSLSPSKQNRNNNLSTSETTIFSTTPVETAASAHSSHSTLSPIRKLGAIGQQPKSVDGDVADCETSSTGSGKSFETHSVASTTPSVQQRLQTTTQTTNTQNQTKTLSSPDSCSSPSGIKEELKRLKYFEISLREQIKDLSLQRDGLVMELQQLHEARPVLEKAYARTTHPTLIQRVNQLELKNRHLQNAIKMQQQYSDLLMNQSWQQHSIELNNLHSRIETQGILLAEQVQRLQSADVLVKDLYVENSQLTATVQRLEQQRARVNMMHHQQQQQQRQHNLNGLPGMP